jgi:hypothetical protein
MIRCGFAGDGTVHIKMGRQQLIHGLDRVTGEGDLGIDNRIDLHWTAVEPAAELLFAPRLPAGISRDHIEDHVGIHEAHPGVGQQTALLADLLGDGHLPFAGDPHDPMRGNSSKNLTDVGLPAAAGLPTRASR